VYISESEGKRTILQSLTKITNADLLRPLYLAVVMGPLALFREEALLHCHKQDWHEHALYLVSICISIFVLDLKYLCYRHQHGHLLVVTMTDFHANKISGDFSLKFQNKA
jgi:hypothetical protein